MIYAIVRLGGSIGTVKVSSKNQLHGQEIAEGEKLYFLEAAKIKVRNLNSTLTKGERSYYKIRYVYMKVENGKYVK